MYVKSVELCCDKEKCVEIFNKTCDKCFSEQDINTICETRFNVNGFKNKYECCDEAIIYFKDDCVDYFKVGMGYIYDITDGKNKLSFYVVEKEQNGKYIRIHKGRQNYSKLKIVECTITCSFNCDKVSGYDKLHDLGFECFPSHHETHIEMFEQEGNSIKMTIKGGFSPLVTTLRIENISNISVHSTDNDNLISYFRKDGNIGELVINTLDKGYRVCLQNNYSSHNMCGDQVEEHINDYEIQCEKLYLDFERNADIVKKIKINSKKNQS